MAKKTAKKVEAPKGLSVKLTTEKSEKGRLTVKVVLFQDGVEIASDYDFVQL